ncbi:UbiA prenyltransferase family-domain-containing protein [Penicillium atrosanguineum]|nr:UbiA prenyltransferase family-domain-containing protein [Penicillium atrosanguineum]
MSTMTVQESKTIECQPPATGLVSHLLPSWVPYAELRRPDRPGKFYALYVLCLFGVGLATSTSPVQLSSSPEPVCTWNDAVDKEFDKKVARGCVRPIARGAVTPFQAYPWATLKTVAIVAILFRLPATCMFFVFLSTIYPFAKRVTYYPQFVLGSIFSLAFFTSVRGMDVDPLSKDNFAPSLCFFAANTIWTTIYDTIYAHQDVADDVHVGVKSMAVHLRNSSKLLTSFLALFITGLLALAGALAGFGPLYYIPVVGESAMGLGATSTLVKLAEAKSFLNPVGWPEPPNSPYVGVTTRCYWY